MKRKSKSLSHSIEKDGNEDIYDLEKYDDEIACAQQELSDIAAKKKDAISSFENVTRNIIADEIEGNHRAEIEEKEQKLQEVNDSLARVRKQHPPAEHPYYRHLWSISWKRVPEYG